MRPRRSPLRRILKGGLILAVLCVGLVLALPAILSMDWARTRVERGLTEALGTPVHIDDYVFGWFSGLHVDRVAVDNPRGFSTDEKLFEMRSLRGDASIVSALRGRYEVSGVVDGLAIRVRQRADGTTNVGELLGVRVGSGGGTAHPDVPEHPHSAPDLSDLRIDLELRDAFVEVVHEERGVLERLENVNARLSKEFGTPVMRVEFACDTHRPGTEQKGRVELRVDAEADPQRPIDAHVSCIGLDLSRYRPVLATFLADDQLTAFAGIVTANARITGVPTDQLTVEGSVDVAGPHFAGPLLQGMDLKAERWTLRPNLTAAVPHDGAAPKLDLSKLTADLGVLKLEGLPSQAGADGAETVGLRFDLDVAALAEAGGPIPALLRQSGTNARGTLHLPLGADIASLAPADLIARVAVDAAVAVKQLRFADQTLTDVAADVGLTGGKLTVATTAGRFQGGALQLRLEADATQLEAPPVHIALGVDGASLGASAVQALQYAVPLLAGLGAAAETGAPVEFQSLGDLHVELSGPAFPKADEGALAWLDRWAGRGNLGLKQGSFRPAEAMSGLLQLTGDSGKLTFSDLSTDFRIAQGFVETSMMKLSAQGREFGLQGRTSLAGAVDYTIDVKQMLKGHADGEKILKYLGDTPIGARLAGTLAAPSLAMPDVGQLAQDALRQALEGEARERIEKEAGGLLDKVLGPRKKDGDAPPSAEDAARKAAEDLLKGIVPPAKEPPKGESPPADPARKALDDLLRGIVPPKPPTPPVRKPGGG